MRYFFATLFAASFVFRSSFIYLLLPLHLQFVCHSLAVRCSLNIRRVVCYSFAALFAVRTSTASFLLQLLLRLPFFPGFSAASFAVPLPFVCLPHRLPLHLSFVAASFAASFTVRLPLSLLFV